MGTAEDGRGGSSSRRQRPAVGRGLAVVVAGYLVLAGAAVLSGLLLTEVLLDGWLGRWDVDVEETLARRRTPTWDGLTDATSRLGDTLTVVALAGVAAALFLWWRGWQPAVLLITALVVEVSVFLTTAAVVDRPRPPVPRIDEVPPTSSYPSGHTAAAVALYVGLALLLASRRPRPRLPWRTLVWLVGLAVAAGVGLSRLYRAMHHPTDVAAGVVIGAASLAVAALAVRLATPPDAADEVAASPDRSVNADGGDARRREVAR